MKQVVLVVGNTIDQADSLTYRIVDQIKHSFSQIQFLPWDPTEELPTNAGQDIILIDTIQGITTVTVFENMNAFTISPHNTVHDFDLPVALTLLQKIGKIRTIKIIGIPYGGNKETVTAALIHELSMM